MHYMRALAKFVRKRSDIRDKLNACGCDQHKKQKRKQWQSFLPGRVEVFVEATCCHIIPYPDLQYAAGISSRIPKLFKWNCVSDLYGDCEVKKMMGITICPILIRCDIIIPVLMWMQAER